jgi:hypothetical protein
MISKGLILLIIYVVSVIIILWFVLPYILEIFKAMP